MSSDYIEHRKHKRQPANYTIEVAPLNDSEGTKIEYLRDISDGGISFTTDDGERYHIGQELMIAIKGDRVGAVSLKSRATIIWIEPSPIKLNTSMVGVRFGELIESQKIVG